MPDLSPLAPWLGAALCTLACGLWSRHRRTRRPVLWAGLLAVGVALLSFMVTAVVHSLCIEVLQRCRSHGDANIGINLGALMGLPLYWLALALPTRAEASAALAARVQRKEATVMAALALHRGGQPPSATCPECEGPISVLQRAEPDGRHQVLSTRCPCGACAARFRAG